MEQQEQQVKQKADWESVKLALGTLGAEEFVNFLAHGGNLAVSGGVEAAIFGGAIAALAGWNAPPIVRWLRASLPQHEELEPFQLLTQRAPGKRSILDKLLDHYPEAMAQLVETEPLQTESGSVLPSSSRDVLYYANDDEEVAPVNVAMDSSLFTFSQVLARGFIPSVNKIFVGRTMEGKDIFVSAEDLCHVALAGKTGGGKGSLMRLLMVQLCHIGAKVLLLNPHYMRWVRAKDGANFDEDWTPFEGINPRTGKPYLEAPPMKSADVEPIAKCLKWSVETLLAKRKEEGREGGKVFAPYFIVLDEWPDVVSEVNKAADYLSKLLRQGRKYGIFVIVASQDFQVKTTGMDGGSVRKCLLTCFYTGGDTTTAKELLYSEKPSSLPENKIGKGTVLLRCTGTKNEAMLAKVPFVDNAAVYSLLGQSTFQETKRTVMVEEPDTPLPQATVPQMPAPVAQPSPTHQGSRELTLERIIGLLESGRISEEMMFKLMDRLPVQSAEEENEVDDPQETSHLRLVSREAVEDEFYAKETERLPETQTPSANTGRFTKALSPELQKAYEAYQQGYTTSRTLAPMMEIGKTKAAELLQELKRRKLVG